MKRFKLLVISIISIIFITGCSTTKKIINVDEFISNCDNLGIDILDVSDYYAFAEDAYSTNSGNYKILYIVGKNLSDITGLFYDEIQNIYSSYIPDDKLTNLKKNTQEGKNWKSVELVMDNNTFYLIYVDNTFLYIKTNESNKELVYKLRDAIKY